jgi:hypothetical protein
LSSNHGYRRVTLIWRRSSPRESEFELLAETLRRIMRDVRPALGVIARKEEREPLLAEA